MEARRNILLVLEINLKNVFFFNVYKDKVCLFRILGNRSVLQNVVEAEPNALAYNKFFARLPLLLKFLRLYKHIFNFCTRYLILLNIYTPKMINNERI